MTIDDQSDAILRARQVLKQWNDKSAADELVASLRTMLAPVVSKAGELSVDAREKLDEVHASLDQVAEKLTKEKLDALDTLMLGLWIRIELRGDVVGRDS